MKLDFFCKSTGRSSEFRTRACLSKSHVLEVIQFNHTLINEHESKLIYKGWCTVFNWIILEMRVRMFAPELKSFESFQLSAKPSSRKIGSQEWRKKSSWGMSKTKTSWPQAREMGQKSTNDNDRREIQDKKVLEQWSGFLLLALSFQCIEVVFLGTCWVLMYKLVSIWSIMAALLGPWW